MHTVDLARELRAAQEAIPDEYIGRLVALGVNQLDAAILVGTAQIRECSGGLFEPAPAGVPALITPVLVDSVVVPESVVPESAPRVGDLVDLVAWFPLEPARWLLRVGTAEWLGAIEPQYLEPPPTPVWRGPFGWLTHGCIGLVPLSRSPHDMYAVLAGLWGIVAEDRHHMRELRRTLERPWPCPPISVRARDARDAT